MPPPSDLDWPRWLQGLQTATLRCQRPDLQLNARLGRAREFIDGHFQEPIDLETIAHQAFFSRYHFLRRFKRHYGETPHQYLTRRRLERARVLLTETDLSVTQVCLEVGFQSLGTFSALFSKRIGHSPMRYRRKVVQNRWDPRVYVPWCMWARRA